MSDVYTIDWPVGETKFNEAQRADVRRKDLRCFACQHRLAEYVWIDYARAKIPRFICSYCSNMPYMKDIFLGPKPTEPKEVNTPIN